MISCYLEFLVDYPHGSQVQSLASKNCNSVGTPGESSQSNSVELLKYVVMQHLVTSSLSSLHCSGQ